MRPVLLGACVLLTATACGTSPQPTAQSAPTVTVTATVTQASKLLAAPPALDGITALCTELRALIGAEFMRSCRLSDRNLLVEVTVAADPDGMDLNDRLHGWTAQTLGTVGASSAKYKNLRLDAYSTVNLRVADLEFSRERVRAFAKHPREFFDPMDEQSGAWDAADISQLVDASILNRAPQD